MKLASYLANGKACFGVVTGDGVVTLNERLGGRYASLPTCFKDQCFV